MPSTHHLVAGALAATVLLAGCGGSSGDAECTQQFWNGEIGLCLTEGWTIIEKDDLELRGVPEEVIAAFQASEPVSGQLPTITITKEVLAQPLDAKTYSDASVRSVASLTSYKQMDSRPITIDGADVTLHTFGAQPLPEEPERRFYQISSVSNGNGYTVTALAPLSVNQALERQLLLMLQSVSFIAPKE